MAEGDQVSINQSGDYLHYIVRFQNTGTFAAQNVVIEDYLESDFDLNTLQITAASHSYRATLAHTNQFKVFFEDINLPASADDEPACHGFVAFKIKPRNNITVGTQIKNQANIHFDFNFPIITNETITTFALLATEKFAVNGIVAVHPNPADDTLYIETQNEPVESYGIYTMLGQLVQTGTQLPKSGMVNVSMLQSGSYLLRIQTKSGVNVAKFLKK